MTRLDSWPTHFWCMKFLLLKLSQETGPSVEALSLRPLRQGSLVSRATANCAIENLAKCNQAVATTRGASYRERHRILSARNSGLERKLVPARNRGARGRFCSHCRSPKDSDRGQVLSGSPKARATLAGLRSFCGQAKYNAPFGLLITQELSGAFGREHRRVAGLRPAFGAVGIIEFRARGGDAILPTTAEFVDVSPCSLVGEPTGNKDVCRTRRKAVEKIIASACRIRACLPESLLAPLTALAS